jgi:hypothetical protein
MKCNYCSKKLKKPPKGKDQFYYNMGYCDDVCWHWRDDIQMFGRFSWGGVGTSKIIDIRTGLKYHPPR